MSTLEEVESAVSKLSPAEKAHLLETVARELGVASPGIESSPNVCGGEACVIRTRIPVWLLEQARRMGSTEAEILLAYPTLRAADLVNAWNYVLSHRDEIERQVRENEEAD